VISKFKQVPLKNLKSGHTTLATGKFKMLTSTASKLSMLKNTEAFLSRFKWTTDEEDYEHSEAALIQLDSVEQKSPSAETTDSESSFASPSESVSALSQDNMEKNNNIKSTIVKEQESLENLDLASFEVVQEGLDNCKTKEDSVEPQVQNNGFGDTADKTLKVYTQPEDKPVSSVKTFFSSFLEGNEDFMIPLMAPPQIFQRDTIIIGDIFSTAVQGIKAGVSFLLGDQNDKFREDILHYRGYKLRTKGMELFLDSVHAKSNRQPDEESSANERKVHFQFKLSKSNLFWQNKQLKKIISLPLKVNWFDQIDSISMFVQVFDSEIELEMPISIPKDSIVVSCDPDQGTLSILAPSYPQ